MKVSCALMLVNVILGSMSNPQDLFRPARASTMGTMRHGFPHTSGDSGICGGSGHERKLGPNPVRSTLHPFSPRYVEANLGSGDMRRWRHVIVYITFAVT